MPAVPLARAWRSALRHTRGRLLAYGDPRGHPRLRQALVDVLSSTRGLVADRDDIVVTRGSTPGPVPARPGADPARGSGGGRSAGLSGGVGEPPCGGGRAGPPGGGRRRPGGGAGRGRGGGRGPAGGLRDPPPPVPHHGDPRRPPAHGADPPGCAPPLRDHRGRLRQRVPLLWASDPAPGGEGRSRSGGLRRHHVQDIGPGPEAGLPRGPGPGRCGRRGLPGVGGFARGIWPPSTPWLP